MIQAPKTVDIYQKEILEALTATGIRQTSPGGKARAFCDIVASALGESETRQFANLSQTLLPYATGSALDYLGEIVGVRRIPRQTRSLLPEPTSCPRAGGLETGPAPAPRPPGGRGCDRRWS